MLIVLWSPKGGSGTSVVSAALALVAARRAPTRLVDLGGDQAAVLGLPSLPGSGPAAPSGCDGVGGWLAAGPAAPSEWLDDLAVAVSPGLVLLPPGSGTPGAASGEAGAALATSLRDTGTVVVDTGSGGGPAVAALVALADAALMVVRPCYPALRRAVGDHRLEASMGVVLVDEPGRSLDASDVAAVLLRPVVARFPVRADIARAVDAGVLRDHMPAALEQPAAALLAAVGEAAGRWAA